MPETPWETARWFIEAESKLTQLHSRVLAIRVPSVTPDMRKSALKSLDDASKAVSKIREAVYSEVVKTRGHVVTK